MAKAICRDYKAANGKEFRVIAEEIGVCLPTGPAVVVFSAGGRQELWRHVAFGDESGELESLMVKGLEMAEALSKH